MKHPIALITAFIGNAGNSGELTFTPEAKTQLDAYGVDVYRFNNDNVELLNTYIKPSLTKESFYKENILDRIIQKINVYKYKQKLYPSDRDNYTRLIAKIPKILFFKLIQKKYNYYIWLDSKFTIYNHWIDYVLWLIERYDDYEIITSKHSERKSVREEFQYMFEYIKRADRNICSKYNAEALAIQNHFFKKKKNYIDDRLYELTMIIYSDKLLQFKKAFLEEWYAHNYYFSIQDQLSFPYLIHKYKVKIKGIEQRVFDMPFVDHEYSRK